MKGPRVLWWADLRRIGGPVPDLLGLLADADPCLPQGPGPCASTTASDSCLTLEKLDALVEQVRADAPPPCRLVVHSLAEGRRLAESMGFQPDLPVYQGVPQPMETYLGIPIRATKGVPAGTAIFIVESIPPRVYVVEVLD